MSTKIISLWLHHLKRGTISKKKAATAVTAVLVLMLNWGTHAEATIVVVMLLFFCFQRPVI
ncbi:MAG: hypothetical protein WCG19_07215 [Chlorobiaceae bacterium]